MPHYSVVLVDLDGTIMDSAPGITSTLAQVLAELGLPVPPPARLLEFVGPPILDGLREIAGLTGAAAQDALTRYRSSYRVRGAFDAEPYDGIREALTTIRDAGLPLAVATSKPESIAKRILERFELASLFTVVAGASDDESRSDKAEVITRCLELLTASGVDVASPVMVGDRVHDVHGATAHGIPVVFAAWGYGSPAEAVGTVASAARPGDLPGLILQRPS